jgi:hypothetical protein
MSRAIPTALLLPLVLCSAGCFAPGTGAKAEAWFKKAEPIVIALAQHHAKHNRYPATLGELVPEYLSEQAWRRSDGTQLGDGFSYVPLGQSYELKFTYAGPGTNKCLYRPDASKWECFGHF